MKISNTKKSHRIISVLLAFTMVIGGIVSEKSSFVVFAAEPSGYALINDVEGDYSISALNQGETCTVILSGGTLSYVRFVEPDADNPEGGSETVTINDASGKNIYLGPGATLIQDGNSNNSITINDNTAKLYVESTVSTNNLTITNNVGYCEINGTCQGNIINLYGNLVINGSHSGEIDNGNSFDLEDNNARLIINGTNSGTINNYSDMTIGASASVTVPTSDIFTNYKNLSVTTFNGVSYGNRFVNLGKITGANIILDSNMGYDASVAVYQVTSSLDIKINDIDGIGSVIASPDAIIQLSDIVSGYSKYVSFKLTTGSVTDKEVTISDDFEPKTARYLAKNIPHISWVEGLPDPLFYGVDYDVKPFISCDSDGPITITYSDMYGDYQSPPTSVKPTEVGEHRVVVSVPETDTYRDEQDYGLHDYNIIYLTRSYDSSMGATLDADLISDGGYYYTNSPVRVVGNEGFRVSVHSYVTNEDSDFADSVVVDEDGYYNGTYAAVRRKSDGATSDYYFVDSAAIYIDQKAPEVNQASVVDQDGNTPDVRVEDGAKIHASRLEFDINDVWDNDNPIYYTALDSVTVNGENVDVDWNTNSAHVVLSTLKERKTYNIVAKDKVGNTSEFSVAIDNLDIPETSISMPASYYGAEVPTPTVTTTSDQDSSNYEFLYKKKGASDDTYSSVKPSAIGDYTVRVNIPYSYNYTESMAESDFSISYLPAPAVPFTVLGVEGENGYYKSDITLAAPEGYLISSSTSDDSFGSSIQYSSNLKSVYLKRIADGARTNAIEVNSYGIDKDAPVFSETAIDAAGEHHALVDGIGVDTTSLSFNVTDANLSSVTVNGESALIAGGKSDIVLSIDAGTEKAFKVIAEDIAGNVSEINVTLRNLPTEEETPAPGPKPEPTLTVSLDDQYYGVDYDPSASTDSNGAEGISFSFRKDIEGSEYESVKPVEPGNYVVKATLPETDHFQGKEAETKFSISYLPAPSDAYTVSGTIGKKDYYVTDARIVAKDGYSISNRLNGTYASSVTYTDGMTAVYLKRNSDNAKTSAITIKEEIKVDKIKPSLSTFGKDQDGKTVDLSSAFYADTVTFSIYDEHLETVYLDDEEVAIKDNTATITIDAEGGKKGSTVKAYDEAGNEYVLKINLMATWMFTNIVPVGNVQLEAGTAYKFGSGHYKFNNDATLYNGSSGSFYVKKSGKYNVVGVD